ncbi:hypothetical protein ACFVVM_13160 [Nocardia sp. NPDC058176]|uniref:hypothetical protein n=1 Tax=Nocardia sp. NPDC058176 TaxID=3346368 RepID=UPI0036DBDC1C
MRTVRTLVIAALVGSAAMIGTGPALAAEAKPIGPSWGLPCDHPLIGLWCLIGSGS